VCISCLRSDLRKSSSCACAQYFCINYSFCSCALRCLSVCVLDHVSVVDSDRRGASGTADGGLLNTTPARQLPEGTVMLLGCIWSTSNLLSHFRTVYVSGKQWRIQNGGGGEIRLISSYQKPDAAVACSRPISVTFAAWSSQKNL